MFFVIKTPFFIRVLKFHKERLADVVAIVIDYMSIVIENKTTVHGKG